MLLVPTLTMFRNKTNGDPRKRHNRHFFWKAPVRRSLGAGMARDRTHDPVPRAGNHQAGVFRAFVGYRCKKQRAGSKDVADFITIEKGLGPEDRTCASVDLIEARVRPACRIVKYNR